MSDYTPIDCSFHDLLEDIAVRKKEVEITYREGSEEKSLTTRITDIQVAGDEEFLILEEDSVMVRLDHLIMVDQHLLSTVSAESLF